MIELNKASHEITHHRLQRERTLERSQQEGVRYHLEVTARLSAHPRRGGPSVSIPDLESLPHRRHLQARFPVRFSALERMRYQNYWPRTLRIFASTVKLAGCNTSPCLMDGAHSLRHSCSRPGHSLCARSATAIFSGVHIFPLFGTPSSAKEASPNTSSNKLRTASSRQGTSSSAATARRSITRPMAQYVGSASQDLARASVRNAPSTAAQLSGVLGAEAERGSGGCVRRSRPE